MAAFFLLCCGSCWRHDKARLAAEEYITPKALKFWRASTRPLNWTTIATVIFFLSRSGHSGLPEP